MDKKIYILALTILVLIIILLFINQTSQKPSNFNYVENATLDSISWEEVEALVFLTDHGKEGKEVHALIGNPLFVKKIVGEELIPKNEKMIFIDKEIFKKTLILFKEANRVKGVSPDDLRAIFITKEIGYVVKISANDDFVYGDHFESRELRKYFEEVGVIEPYDEDYPSKIPEIFKQLRKTK